MSRVLTLPRLGETMEEGLVVGWLVAPGSAFRRGDVLLEIETDKTVVEVPALEDGTLEEILVAEGVRVGVGAPIARLAGEGARTLAETTETLVMPQLGETMERAVLVTWSVGPGDEFSRGDTLAEIETDKTLAEVPALAAGRLLEHLVKEGETVEVGAPIARVATTGAVPATTEARDRAPAVTKQTPVPQPRPRTALGHGIADRVRATPVARRLARAAGIDLAGVAGTGRRGRVEAIDLRSLLDARKGSRGTDLRNSGGVAYRVYGQPGGAPVVLLHGFAADHAIWAGLASALAREGRCVLAVDLPGHGAASAEAERPEDLSEGLQALVRKVLHGPAHVIAHSLGAIPAADLALGGAALSLTLIAPAGLGEILDPDTILGLSTVATSDEAALLLGRMTEGSLPLSKAALQGIADTLRRGRLRRLAKEVAPAGGKGITIRDQLAEIAATLPVRVLAPHRDRIFDWRDMVSVSPRIAVHHLPDAGHMAAWDAPGEVLGIVLDATGR